MHILVIPSFLPPYGGAFAIEQAKALARRGNKVGIIHCQQLGVTVYPRHYFTAPYTTWEESFACAEETDINFIATAEAASNSSIATAEAARNNTSTTAEDTKKSPGYTAETPVVHCFMTNMRGIPLLTRFNSHRYCRLIERLFVRYVAVHGIPDIIHAHCSQWAGVAAMHIMRRHGVPYIITEHISAMMFRNAYGDGWTRHAWAKQLLSDALLSAGNLITVSPKAVSDIQTLFCHDIKPRVISNIIDTAFFAYRDREPLRGRPFRYCCLAFANGEGFHLKGYDTLLKAFNATRNAELHIAGRATDSAMMRRMTAALCPQNVSRVVLHGDLPREGVRSLLYRCDALVLASRSETQGLVVLEALSTGIPAVVTSGVPFFPAYEDHVLTSPAGDSAALLRNMEAVTAMPPSSLRHSAIESMASPEHIAMSIEEVMKETVSSHRR